MNTEPLYPFMGDREAVNESNSAVDQVGLMHRRGVGICVYRWGGEWGSVFIYVFRLDA